MADRTMSDPAPPTCPDVLAACGLPERWRARERFVLLDLGCGPQAQARLATLRRAWQADPQRGERLVVLAAHGPDSADLDDAGIQWMRLPDGPRAQDLDARLRGLQAAVDAVVLGTDTAWTADLLRHLGRLATPQATLWTRRMGPAVQAELARHGFVTDPTAPSSAGPGTRARFAPRFTPPAPLAFRPPHVGPRHALVVGAGLAGCAAAWALSRQGWASTVLDRQAEPALETSGNPGGLVHGTFNAPDSLHARWFRAAARLMARLAAPAIAAGTVAGDLRGFVRLEPRLDAAQAAAQLARVDLPADYLHWLSTAQAQAHTGLPLDSGGWCYPQGGWLSPRDWSRWLLAQAVSRGLASFRGDTAVAAIRRVPGGPWQALDAQGRVLAEAPVVVLATAHAVDTLLAPHARPTGLQAVRGQTTLLAADTPGLRPPRSALSGQGYGLTLPDGRVLIGATSQPGDPDPQVRADDHRHNLARAARLGLCPATLTPDDAAVLSGRVGWRATSPDRLPLIGPPLDPAAPGRSDQRGRTRQASLRQQPRCHGADHGLYVFAGLGSRGLTSAALGAQVLAAWVSGAPFPVEATLLDALDPARTA